MRVNLLTEKQAIQAEGLATYSLEAESTLILCAVGNPHVALRISSALQEADFGDERAAVVFRHIKGLCDRGQRVTYSSLRDRLNTSGDMAIVGHTDFDSVAIGVAADDAAPWALERVLRASERRQLLAAARAIAARAIDLSCEHPTNDAFTALMNVNEHRAEETIRHVSEVIRSKVDGISRAHDARAAGKSLVARTGFACIDDQAVLDAGKLIILAARPGMGKSLLAWNIATHVAAERLVVFTTLEMEGEELAGRQIMADLGVSSHDQATGAIYGEKTWAALYGMADKYKDLLLYIDDAPAADMAGIEASARRAAAMERKPIGLLVVDYLGLVDGEGKDDTSKTAQISRAAKKLAKKLKCPVLLLSQLNRGVEQRENKRPMLSDLRQSGSIEQDASIVLFVYRDEYYNPGTDDRGIAEVIIAKNRDGLSGITTRLYWRPAAMRFQNIPSLTAGYFAGGGGAE